MKALSIFLVILGLIVAAAAIYALVVRPQMKRWGLTDAEISQPLPGDELVPTPRWGFKQAITINAPAKDIYPWIIQMGLKRAGWYSLDAVEKAIGAGDFVDGASSTRIVPELQNLKLGDSLNIAPTIGFKVKRLEPNQLMVLHACANTKLNQDVEPTTPLPPDVLNVSWTYYLQPIDDQTTRLFVRFVFDSEPTFTNTMMYGMFTEGGALMMSPAQLKGIKARAEAMYKAGK